MGKVKPIVHISKSFKEAREWDRKYEESLSSEQRHEGSMYLKKIYCIRKGIKFNKIEPVVKIRKIFRGKYNYD